MFNDDILADVMSQKGMSMLGGDHIYDLNDQEGQTPLLEMPRRSTESHYTEQILSCAASATIQL